MCFTPSASTATVQVAYIHTDHLNTPRLIIDPTSNTPIWRWENVQAFGSNLVDEDPDNDGTDFEYNLRFAGQYFDKETNLHYNYFRTYDVDIGRYVSSDPIGLNGGLNTYGYVGGNPLRFVDPAGLETTIVITYDTEYGITYGSHAALFIGRGDDGNPALYDPAGSYFGNGEIPPREGSGMFFGERANLGNYIQYHKDSGSSVITFTFNTSLQNELNIFNKAFNVIGDPRGFSCSNSVSKSLDGIGPFLDLGSLGFPGDLANKLHEMINRQHK